jgi:hypothetical protein
MEELDQPINEVMDLNPFSDWFNHQFVKIFLFFSAKKFINFLKKSLFARAF